MQFAVYRIPVYLCPSSPELYDETVGLEYDGQKLYTMHYYGIEGPVGVNASTGVDYAIHDESDLFGGNSEEGIFYPDQVRSFRDVIDGTSNTVFVGEMSWTDRNGVGTRYRMWTRGANLGSYTPACRNVGSQINADSLNPYNAISFGSNHTGGTHVLMGDGTVRFFSENMNYATWLGACSIRGGEVVSF